MTLTNCSQSVLRIQRKCQLQVLPFPVLHSVYPCSPHSFQSVSQSNLLVLVTITLMGLNCVSVSFSCERIISLSVSCMFCIYNVMVINHSNFIFKMEIEKGIFCSLFCKSFRDYVKRTWFLVRNFHLLKRISIRALKCTW